MKMKDIYEHLVNKPHDPLIKTGDGSVIPFEQYIEHNQGWEEFNIYPGSFNPIHPGHKAIFSSMTNHTWCGCCMYELSINRMDKEHLSPTDLENRLSQFNNELVLLTAHANFLSKTGLIREIISYDDDLKFHIGYDTAIRLLDDVGTVGAYGIWAEFVVYPRKIDDTLMGLQQISNAPRNFLDGNLISNEHAHLSSTELRNEN